MVEGRDSPRPLKGQGNKGNNRNRGIVMKKIAVCFVLLSCLMVAVPALSNESVVTNENLPDLECVFAYR